jgi:hypothetical protein
MLKILSFLLLFISISNAQTQYFVNTNPACHWDSNKEVDLAGYVVHLDIFKYNEGTQDTIIFALSQDTTFMVPNELLFEADYRFGIQAVDLAGNKSDITWSNKQCFSSTTVCWYARYDITSPGSVRSIKPSF